MKLNKARHCFSKEVSWNIPADFQPVPSEVVINELKMFIFICSFIKAERQKTFHGIGMISCQKSSPHWQMSALISLQQWLMTTWKHQTSTMYVELYTGLYLNCCDFFYLLEYFISGIGMLLEFRLLFSPDIFLKAKKRKSRGLYHLHHSTLALDSLVMEVSESRPFSNYFMRLANVVFSPSASWTSVFEFLQPFFLVAVRPGTHGCSEPNILFDAEPVGSTRCSSLRLLQRLKWERGFEAFSLWHK